MSRFSDLDLDFTLNPISKDVNILRDTEAIKRSVRNIVLYNFLEKPFKPTFGGNVTAQLFENVNPISALKLKVFVEKAIVENEPRVYLNEVNVVPEFDRNAFSVTIKFTPINSPQPIKISVNLERVR